MKANAPVASSSSSANTSKPIPQKSKAEEGVFITVEKTDLIDNTEKAITDAEQIQKTLTLVDSLLESNFTRVPFTGGTVFYVSITRDRSSDKYSFLEHEVDGHRLAKNHQNPDADIG